MIPIHIETYKDEYGQHRWRVVMNGNGKASSVARLDGFPAYSDKGQMMAIIQSFVAHIKHGKFTIESEPTIRKKWY